jgi:agmatine/peptidylarginine deiminase
LIGHILLLGAIIRAVISDSFGDALASENPAKILDRQIVGDFAKTDAVAISEDLLTADYRVTEIIRAIFSANARVWILVRPKSDAAQIKKKLLSAGLSTGEIAGVSFTKIAHGGPWLRDYGPLFVIEKGLLRGADKPTLALADPRYRDPEDPSSDIVPQVLADILKVPVIPLPLDLDGGNLLTSGQMCLTSHMAGGGPVATNLEEALRNVGCKTVLDLDNAPHVHVDMWVKVASPDLALVHELDERTVAVARRYFGGLPDDLARLKVVLDEKAKVISQHMRVRRLPLPLPFRNVFRSYTNALLVNGTAIVPRFKYFGWTRDIYPDDTLNGQYERTVEKVYKEAGFRVVWVNADGLIYNGGGFRCASFQIPRLASIISHRKGSPGGGTL